MRTAVAQWSAHTLALLAGTGRAWRACLPELIVGLALGQVGYHGALVTASLLSENHPWVALGVVSLGFSAMLIGYLYCLRTLGRHLAVDAQLSQTGEGEAHLKESLTHVVAITLLPFLGIYAVFGKVEQTSSELYVMEGIARGVMPTGVLSQLNPQTTGQAVVIGAVLAAAYVIRRLLDFAHEKTGLRVLGFFTGIVETFFMLVLIFGGTRMISSAGRWLSDRQVVSWINHGLSSIAGLLRGIYSRLPEWLLAGWEWLTGPAWTTLLGGLGSPLLWLAIAALAFGSRITSLSELWRNTLGARVVIPKPAQALASTPARRLGSEVKELFLGDIDDKYLPTWYSLRLVVASGLSLVGAFCLLHAVVSLIEPGVWWIAQRVVGPRESTIWVQLMIGLRITATLLMEPLRLSLLAVTFLRCLQILSARVKAVG